MSSPQNPIAPVEELKWRSLRELTVEGIGWPGTAGFYDRLPDRAKGVVPESVWGLSRHSAGIAARFVTDATRIWARWTLRCENLAMYHMPATGVSGIDLYALHDGRWRWMGITRDIKWPRSQSSLVEGLSPGRRHCMAYLPLYNGVDEVEIGVPADSALEPAGDRPSGRNRPICVYGTSIVQGGCASRPGMAYPAIIGRRLDCPVINFGFSGSGKMEPVMADLLAELDPSVYVIDCLPNMRGEPIETKIDYLARRLRQSHPRTPVVFVDNVIFADSPFCPTRDSAWRERNRRQRSIFDQLVKSGIGGLHYLPAESLIGDDFEATVDGTHLTDLGYHRLADALTPLLARLI